MRPKGLIYKETGSGLHGEVVISLPFAVKVVYRLLRGVGAGLVAYFFIMIFFILGPLLKEELRYRFDLKGEENERNLATLIDPADADYTIGVQKEADGYGINSYFSVAIPKIGAYSDIVANVDAGSKEEYLGALTRGVAHTRGTYFPGQGKSILLFAHSTDSPANIVRFNAVFFLLRKLERGDKVIIYFADRKYIYEVTEKVIAEPTDTLWLGTGDSERLVLLTCDPPGTTWRRLIVIAEPI